MAAEVCTLLDKLCSHTEPDAQCVMSGDTTYCAIKSSKHGYLAEDVSISMASDIQKQKSLCNSFLIVQFSFLMLFFH